MKKVFKSIMFVAAAAMAFTACSVDDGAVTPVRTLTLVAENPETRTALGEDGQTPMWLPEDVIGVATADGTTNVAFTNTSATSTSTTSFTGNFPVSEDITVYAYYPYATVASVNNAVGVDFPSKQNPTATSFDPAADLLMSRPIEVSADVTTVDGVSFARVSSLLKLVLVDKTTGTVISNDNLNNLTITASEAVLTGRVKMNFEEYSADRISSAVDSKSVTVNYTESTAYTIGAEGEAIYIGVLPQTLAADSYLTITASTDHHAINKKITLPSDIELKPGFMTTLNIGIADENVVEEAAGLALPVTENFDWMKSMDSSLSGKWISLLDYNTELYSYSNTYNAMYQESDGTRSLKLGNLNTGRGQFVTVDLDLSKPFTVTVEAKVYPSSSAGLQITVGEQTQEQTLAADYQTYTYTFDAAKAKEKVQFDVTGKSCLIKSFSITNTAE